MTRGKALLARGMEGSVCQGTMGVLFSLYRGMDLPLQAPEQPRKCQHGSHGQDACVSLCCEWSGLLPLYNRAGKMAKKMIPPVGLPFGPSNIEPVRAADVTSRIWMEECISWEMKKYIRWTIQKCTISL